MDLYKTQFLDRATQQATRAGHIYPAMAACEAALESNFGTSALAIADFNLFGMKAHANAQKQDVVYLPTNEYLHGGWVKVSAGFMRYPDWATCFEDRMFTLNRLRDQYPHYAAALLATTPEQYIDYVSLSWSTDPNRGSKVLAIYKEYVKDKTNEVGRVST